MSPPHGLDACSARPRLAERKTHPRCSRTYYSRSDALLVSTVDRSSCSLLRGPLARHVRRRGLRIRRIRRIGRIRRRGRGWRRRWQRANVHGERRRSVHRARPVLHLLLQPRHAGRAPGGDVLREGGGALRVRLRLLHCRRLLGRDLPARARDDSGRIRVRLRRRLPLGKLLRRDGVRAAARLTSCLCGEATARPRSEPLRTTAAGWSRGPSTPPPSGARRCRRSSTRT